jgi:hypothetical protein
LALYIDTSRHPCDAERAERGLTPTVENGLGVQVTVAVDENNLTGRLT